MSHGAGAAWLVLLAGLILKMALLWSLPTSTPLVVLLARFASSFGIDVVVALAFFGASRWLPRTAWAGAIVVALLAAVDVTFVATFGQPLSVHQLAYADGGSLTQLSPQPLLASACVCVGVLIVSVALWRRRRRLRARAVLAFSLLLGGAAVGGVGADDDEARHAMGLDQEALVAFIGLRGDAEVGPSPELDPSVGLRLPPASLVPAPRGVDVPPQHVVLYISESTASRFVDVETMPALTALVAANGVQFEQHVAESPLSIKAIFALMCGLHPLPSSSLETTAIPRIDCSFLPDVVRNVVEDPARNAGVVTTRLSTGLFHGGYFAFTDKLAFLGERGFDVLEDGENLAADGVWRNGWGVDDRVVVDRALRFLDERPDPKGPSLSVLIPLVPHYEYFLPDDAPRPFGEKTLVDRYKNGLRFADDTFARLVAGYRERGLFEDTLFVFVGDHGEAFDEHPHNRLHGTFLYEENLRAPLMIIQPGRFPVVDGAPPRRSQRPTSHADVLPTILDLLEQPVAGFDISKGSEVLDVDGQSAFGTAPPRPIPISTLVGSGLLGLRTPAEKVIVDLKTNSTTLYDLTRDPKERAPIRDGARVTALGALARSTAAHQERRLEAWAQASEAPYLQRVAAASGLVARREKVFNMERWCMPSTTSSTAAVTVVLKADPPIRHLGVGVTDRSRFARRGAVKVQADIGGDNRDDDVVNVVVDDAFLTSSVVVPISLAAHTLSVTLAPNARQAEVCLWVQP